MSTGLHGDEAARLRCARRFRYGGRDACNGNQPFLTRPNAVSTRDEIVEILDEALNLNGRGSTFTHGTRLLGQLPELDSMAVVTVIAALEERFGFTVNDDEIDGSVFETLGSLQQFVDAKLG